MKYAVWVQNELEILEKAGIIIKSLTPCTSPTVVVAKKSQPDEPPRRGYVLITEHSTASYNQLQKHTQKPKVHQLMYLCLKLMKYMPDAWLMCIFYF